MKERKLVIFNGGDWDSRGGHLFIAAWSQRDAVDLITRAWLKGRDIPASRHGDYKNYPISPGYLRAHFARGCWGNSMDGVVPERGVWHAKAMPGGAWHGKPERIL